MIQWTEPTAIAFLATFQTISTESGSASTSVSGTNSTSATNRTDLPGVSPGTRSGSTSSSSFSSSVGETGNTITSSVNHEGTTIFTSFSFSSSSNQQNAGSGESGSTGEDNFGSVTFTTSASFNTTASSSNSTEDSYFSSTVFPNTYSTKQTTTSFTYEFFFERTITYQETIQIPTVTTEQVSESTITYTELAETTVEYLDVIFDDSVASTTTQTTSVAATGNSNAANTIYQAEPGEVLWITAPVSAASFASISHAVGSTATETTVSATREAYSLVLWNATEPAFTVTRDSSATSFSYFVTTASITNKTVVTKLFVSDGTSDVTTTSVAITETATGATLASSSAVYNATARSTDIYTYPTTISKFTNGQTYNDTITTWSTLEQTVSQQVVTTGITTAEDSGLTHTAGGNTLSAATAQKFLVGEVRQFSTLANGAQKQVYLPCGFIVANSSGAYPLVEESEAPAFSIAQASRTGNGMSYVLPRTNSQYTVNGASYTYKTTTGSDSSTLITGEFVLSGDVYTTMITQSGAFGGYPAGQETFVDRAPHGVYSFGDSTTYLNGNDDVYAEGKAVTYWMPAPQIVGNTTNKPLVTTVSRNASTVPDWIYIKQALQFV